MLIILFTLYKNFHQVAPHHHLSLKSNILMELESYYHQKISIKKIIWIRIFLRLQLKHTQAYLLNVMVWWSPTNYEAQNCTWLKVWVFKEKRFLKILLNFRFLSINVQSTYIWLKLTIDKKTNIWYNCFLFNVLILTVRKCSWTNTVSCVKCLAMIK